MTNSEAVMTIKIPANPELVEAIIRGVREGVILAIGLLGLVGLAALLVLLVGGFVLYLSERKGRPSD